MNAMPDAGAVALRLALTLLAGLVIGFDRDRHAQPAGLRTTVLVTLAAAVAAILANLMAAGMPAGTPGPLRLDVMRLPQGILAGIGFIGAGAILRRGDRLRGVTTAATLWMVTVIGLSLGSGQLALGAAATLLAVAVLWLLRLAETGRHASHRGVVTIAFDAATLTERDLLATLAARRFILSARKLSQNAGGPHALECSGRYRGRYPEWSCALVQDLAARPGVRNVLWRDID